MSYAHLTLEELLHQCTKHIGAPGDLIERRGDLLAGSWVVLRLWLKMQLAKLTQALAIIECVLVATDKFEEVIKADLASPISIQLIEYGSQDSKFCAIKGRRIRHVVSAHIMASCRVTKRKRGIRMRAGVEGAETTRQSVRGLMPYRR